MKINIDGAVPHWAFIGGYGCKDLDPPVGDCECAIRDRNTGKVLRFTATEEEINRVKESPDNMQVGVWLEIIADRFGTTDFGLQGLAMSHLMKSWEEGLDEDT